MVDALLITSSWPSHRVSPTTIRPPPTKERTCQRRSMPHEDAQSTQILAGLPKLGPLLKSAKSKSPSSSRSPMSTLLLAKFSKATTGDSSRSTGYRAAKSSHTCDLISRRTLNHSPRRLQVPPEGYDPPALRHYIKVCNLVRRLPRGSLPTLHQNPKCTMTT